MWYQYLNKSLLTPPDIVFRIVWPILYILMIISLILFYKNYSSNFWISLGLLFFTIQLLLNLLWPLLFFTYHQILPSFFLIITIILFVILTMKEFLKVNFTAGILLLPYLLWLIFASYLNLFIYASNE